MVKTKKVKIKPKKLTRKKYRLLNGMMGAGPRPPPTDISEEQRKLFHDAVIKEHGSIDSLLKKTNPVKKAMLDSHKIHYEQNRKSELEKAITNPEKIKIIPDKKSLITNRKTTLLYEGIKDYVDKHYEINQPKFTPEDQKKKEDTWFCHGGTSCFSDEPCDKNKGDHIYGMREVVIERGIIGSNSLWNKIPCKQDENVTWKLNAGPLKKNLVYDTFTKEEVENFTEQQKDWYDRLQKWKEYCKTRGAKLYWINGKEINDLVEKVIAPLILQMDIAIKDLPIIPQNKQLSDEDDDDDDEITEEALLKALEEHE